MKYPFNVRSFFTSRETKDIGSGLELWRGYVLFFPCLYMFSSRFQIFPECSSRYWKNASVFF